MASIAPYREMCGTHMGTWFGGTAGAIDYKIVKIGENLILILTLAEKCDIMDLHSDSADVEVKGFFRSALDVT